MPDGMRMMVPTDLEALRGSPLFSDQALRSYEAEPDRAVEFKAAAAASTDESVADFVRRHFGDEVADKLAGPLLAGVFGGSIDTLSVRAVMPAFVKMEREHGSLIAALQQRMRADRNTPVFTTLASGLGTLVDSMTAQLPQDSVRLRTEVRALDRLGAHWRVSSQAGDELFDAVIVATPAHVSRGILAALDPRIESLLAMDATSAIVVALAFTADRAHCLHIPGGFGFLVPQRQGAGRSKPPSLLACTFVDQKFSHRAPQGAVLLRGFFGGEVAPALMGESDESLIGRAREQLSRVLGELPEAAETMVRRWPRSLPQYAVGHLERIAELEARLRLYPGLLLIGNAYHGVGLPDLIRDGRAAASDLIATLSPNL